TVVNSQFDESMKTVVADSEKDTSIDPDDVIVDDTVSKDRSAIKTLASVVGRTRSRAGKNVATASTPVQTS
ncbi:hypothetical protein A2U01_0111344, partial [Trifolium medium]|nr:hypothetical protein [Trifolium medium]